LIPVEGDPRATRRLPPRTHAERGAAIRRRA
jgi:hypothetical protein